MKFKAYKSNLGLFIYPESSIYGEHRINGNIKVQSGWQQLKDVFEITSYEVLQAGENKLTGFVLKISSVACEDIPLNLTPEQVDAYYDDAADERKWRNYSEYEALYKPVYEKTTSQWKNMEFSVEIIRDIQIDNYEEPLKMSIGTAVRMQEPAWNVSDELAKVVIYEDLERILTPEFLLHERPCQMHPIQLYSIIRHWVSRNINPKVAFISSDYDFCFTVKRRIAIKPVVVKTEIKKQNGRSFATPKFNTKQLTHKEEILFEMAPKVYNKYPVLEQWHASNLKEMAFQLKNYLDNLMEEINADVEECPHCKGVGAIVNQIDVNDRKGV